MTWGAGEDVIRDFFDRMNEGVAKDGDREFRLWPENARPFQAFLAVSNQLIFSPKGRVLGLNYQSAAAAWSLLRLTITADDFRKIQLIEQEIVRYESN